MGFWSQCPSAERMAWISPPKRRKAKAHPCFKRCTCNRVWNTRFVWQETTSDSLSGIVYHVHVFFDTGMSGRYRICVRSAQAWAIYWDFFRCRWKAAINFFNMLLAFLSLSKNSTPSWYLSPLLLEECTTLPLISTNSSSSPIVINNVLSNSTGLNVLHAEDPLTCVARGTSIYLESLEILKDTQEHGWDWFKKTPWAVRWKTSLLFPIKKFRSYGRQKHSFFKCEHFFFFSDSRPCFISDT